MELRKKRLKVLRYSFRVRIGYNYWVPYKNVLYKTNCRLNDYDRQKHTNMLLARMTKISNRYDATRKNKWMVCCKREFRVV